MLPWVLNSCGAANGPGRLAELIHRLAPRTICASSQLSTGECSILAAGSSIPVFSPCQEVSEGLTPGSSPCELIKAGAAIALSTGFHFRHSPSYSMQMALFFAVIHLRLSIEQAISAATVNAAHAVGVGHLTGSIEVGKRADLLLLMLPDYHEISRQFGINHVGMAIREGNVVFNRTKMAGRYAMKIECVPNFSEGRNQSSIDTIEQAIQSVDGVLVLHRTSDVDHNRSVITFAADTEPVIEAAVRAAAQASALINLNHHCGVHPRLGALDVLPFVPLEDATLDDCVAIARRAGNRIWKELGIPVYFYEAAALRPDRVRLEDVRRGEFEGLREIVFTEESRRPDLGGPALHPTAGAVIVGARRFLIAYNIDLRTSDIALAQSIARRIRTSSGGLTGRESAWFAVSIQESRSGLDESDEL